MVRTPSLSISSGDMDKEKANQTLSSAFASMMAVGAPHQTSRNLFAASPSASQLKIDDASDSRQDRSSTSSKNEDERSQRKSRRFSAFSRSSRSVSPFRFGSKKRSASANRLKINPDEDVSEREKDSDSESVTSSGSGIAPRNSAFYNHDDEDDLDASIPHSHRRHHPASLYGSESQLPKASSSTSLTSTTQPADDAHDAEADVESDDASVTSDLDAKHPFTNVDEADNKDQEDEDDPDEIDPIVLDNTIYNAEYLTSHEHWHGASEHGHPHFETYEDEDLERDDEHITAPNVVLSEDQVSTFLQRRGSKMLSLTTTRPRYERNRCTIGISHGDADAAAKKSKRPKRYVVASDGSEESSYAVEWTIGTVLRDGDEMLVVSVMETDTKLDALDPTHEEAAARMEHQRIRQAMASVLAKQATHLLERTRLEVKISCQAIHAKNARHMLLDLIDFYEPTMVVVGSRGLGSLKGILLGSTSHYLVQKSSAPVMVARKRLKLPALPRGKGDVVESVRARHMRLDQASIEKASNVGEDVPSDKDAQGEGTGGDDSSPDNEDGSADKVDSAPTDAAAVTGDTTTAIPAATTASSTPPPTNSAAPSKPLANADGSPKLQRKGSKAGHSAISHTSLDGEAETRIQIQQRKEEAARLHEGDKKRHAFGSHHLKTSKAQPSDDDTDPTDDNLNPTASARTIDAAAAKQQ
ncbi:hypothetical protein EX895_002648 [Sporisorium graminicola]|uniref:UspA domain-containing protein n=1 Tax=Sporisorium graminicola TaxID=280036 RepID=A0A4U7KVS4_9BASI|nr:hypothetical protein EX895_002648 [Sporisorium graminicola]TKY88296.1 hypothetical protein EX895_002648 [Sporisorium graminicola]